MSARMGGRGAMRRGGLALAVLLSALGTAVAAHGQASFRPRFLPQAPFAVNVGDPVGRQAMALGDLNGDQRPDLVAIAPDDAQVTVQLNDGHGGFGSATAYATELDPSAVAIADVGSPFSSPETGAPDGRVDLIVGGEFGEVQILYGLQDGSFEAGDLIDYFETSEIRGVVVGEFNGAPGADVALLDFDGVLVLCNAAGELDPCGDGELVYVGLDPIEMVSGDFNGDGHPDLAALDAENQRVWPLLGNGDGSFVAAPSVSVAAEAAGGTAVDVAVTRMDDDALDDLVVVNDSDDLQFLGVTLLGTSRGTFRVRAFVIDFGASSVAAGDFDADGLSDVITGYGARGVTVNIGDGTGVPADPFTPVGTAVVGSVGLTLSSDLDGDGKRDLLLVRADGTSARVLLNGTLPFCAGDCNADGNVSIDELTRGVAILLGEQDVRQCVASDVDGTLSVAVNELVAAVNRALTGCPTS